MKCDASKEGVDWGDVSAHDPHPRRVRAFTLIELLVVIAIMGIIAGLAVPAFKNLGKANVQAGATRQLLDDIGRARQLAISQHTTVYMVFVPTNFFTLVNINGNNIQVDLNNPVYIPLLGDRQLATAMLSNLVDKQLSGYNFLSYGKVGDQPGQHVWHYLGDWQALPEGTFVAAAKFLPQKNSTTIPLWQANNSPVDTWFRNGASLIPQINGFTNRYVPFPTEASPLVPMPYLAFDHTGRLVSETDSFGNIHHAYIPLAQGVVGFGHDANKQPTLAPVLPADIIENPAGNSTNISYNVIDVDPLSGRAKSQVFHMK